jgi:hypothetical protein
MKALVAVLDEWNHLLTPSERGVASCGTHSARSEIAFCPTEQWSFDWSSAYAPGNQQFDEFVDLLATGFVHSTPARGC